MEVSSNRAPYSNEKALSLLKGEGKQERPGDILAGKKDEEKMAHWKSVLAHGQSMLKKRTEAAAGGVTPSQSTETAPATPAVEDPSTDPAPAAPLESFTP
jgi:hypothetical protein